MKCLNCGNIESKVIDSRLSDDGTSIRRRRECLGCARRFTTFERTEIAPILVVKSDGARQPFDASKIKRGLIKATEKRPIPMEKIDKLVADIERKIQNSLVQEINSKKIGEMVMDALMELDPVAYVRFACVYKEFKNVDTFIDEIETIIKRNDRN